MQAYNNQNEYFLKVDMLDNLMTIKFNNSTNCMPKFYPKFFQSDKTYLI